MSTDKINILTLLSFFAILMGCQEEEILQEANSQKNKIQFSVTTEPLAQTTRAALTTDTKKFQEKPFGLFGFVHEKELGGTESINNIGVKVLNNEKFSFGPTGWTSPSSTYWSDLNPFYSFYAYHPFEEIEYEIPGSPESGIYVYTDAGNLYLQYHPNKDCSKQPDLMIAANINSNKPTRGVHASSAEPLAFFHALTAIGFKITGSLQEVTKISISKIQTPGYLRPENISIAEVGKLQIKWELGDEFLTSSTSAKRDPSDPYSKGFTVNETNELVIGDNGYMMILPQTLHADAAIEITVNGIEHKINIGGQVLKAGEKVLFNLDLPLRIQDFTVFVEGKPTDRIWYPYGGYKELVNPSVITEEVWNISDTIRPNWKLNNLITTLKEVALVAQNIQVHLKMDEVPSFDPVVWMGNNAIKTVSLTNASKIAKGMFAGSKKLTTVYSPGITEFPEQAYDGCSVLESIDNLDNITMVDNRAFAECKKLTHDIVIKNVNRIGKSAFAYSGIKTVNAAFNQRRESSKGNVVDSSAFAGCISLKSATLTQIDSIKKKAFSDCITLNNLELESIKYIGDSAFFGCKEIEKFSFPKINKIENNAFTACFTRPTTEINYELIIGSTTNTNPPILGDFLFGYDGKNAKTDLTNVTLTIGKVGKVEDTDGAMRTIETTINKSNSELEVKITTKENITTTTTYSFKQIINLQQ